MKLFCRPLPYAALALLSIAALGATSASAETLKSKLQTCTQYSDDTKRLSCYDELADNLKQHAISQFGQEQKTVIEGAPESIVATISSVQKGAYGKYTFVLNNGQIWRQTGSTKVIWKGGEQIELDRGVLGAFYMRKVSGGRSVKVKRIQ
ncbi:hypothetical protein [Microbulbifer aggregans]|uniref:hypothetical protein n=1 Tax=Microbulbifer aggregans TaxID=1769779 RepID=UPI001CFD5C70|nr:hypothetical protein [Microbulbifer aggregans]